MNPNHVPPQYVGATGGYDNDVFLDTSVDSFVTVSTGDTLTASNHSRHRCVKLYFSILQTEVLNILFLLSSLLRSRKDLISISKIS